MDKSVTSSGVRPYHHGDLKSALLTEAETILERDGIQCLTLRAAARAAGVSHAAPTNHFGDLTGLLTELAAVGFNRFTAALMAAGADGDGPSSRGKAMGQAYVRFARDHPGLFVLMFRSERLDVAKPVLRQAMDAAAETLRSASNTQNATTHSLRVVAQATAHWSLVHGFSMLLLDGRLDGMIRSLPRCEQPEDLLDSVLAITRIGD
jgi:AcrR family transcriptional regulator